MDSLGYYSYEERYKKRSKAIAISVGILLVFLILFPFLTYPVPPLGQEGILVNLGVIDFGQGEENGAAAAAPIAEQAQEEASAEEAVEEPVEEPEFEPVPEPVKATPPPAIEERKEPVKPSSAPDPDLIRQQNEAALALRERQAAERRANDARNAEAAAERAQRAEQAERQAQQRAAAEAEAKRQADAKAAADRKAAAEARAAALKASTGSLFNGGGDGNGGGKGNTGKSGNQGDPNGDPNASRTMGLSSGGTGNVGGGLMSRGVVRSPKINDSSQESGKVVITVCVDAAGKVTRADFTQRGSTTSNARLVELARRNAANYVFTASQTDEQCGNITYEFVVR